MCLFVPERKTRQKQITFQNLKIQAFLTLECGCDHGSGCEDGCEGVPPHDLRLQNGNACANLTRCDPPSDPQDSPKILLLAFPGFLVD